MRRERSRHQVKFETGVMATVRVARFTAVTLCGVLGLGWAVQDGPVSTTRMSSRAPELLSAAWREPGFLTEDRCIGALDVRKFFYDRRLGRVSAAATRRCAQSVARVRCAVRHPLTGPRCHRQALSREAGVR